MTYDNMTIYDIYFESRSGYLTTEESERVIYIYICMYPVKNSFSSQLNILLHIGLYNCTCKKGFTGDATTNCTGDVITDNEMIF